MLECWKVWRPQVAVFFSALLAPFCYTRKSLRPHYQHDDALREVDRLAVLSRTLSGDLSSYDQLPQERVVWIDFTDAQSGLLSSRKYRGRICEARTS